MNAKKILSIILAMAMVLGLAACGKTEQPEGPVINTETEQTADTTTTEPEATEAPEVVRPESYERYDDEELYMEIFGKFYDYEQAGLAADDFDEALLLYARAEAELLGTYAVNPLYTYEAGYAISSLAPNTGAYYMGAGSSSVENCVAADRLITAEDREALLALWEASLTSDDEYDPKAYLEEHGYGIKTDLVGVFGSIPTTLDRCLTFESKDYSYLDPTNLTLVDHDYKGKLYGKCAESWDVSDDGLTYTFNIRKGINWYTSEGTAYAELTANDWVAGFRHLCDAQYGYEAYLLSVEGVFDYAYAGGSWEDVGIKALDDYTLQITFTEEDDAFLDYASNSFYPICDSWFLAHGGAYGVEEYAAAATSGNYTYADSSNVASQVYCGPYYFNKITSGSEIKYIKNKNYYDADSVLINTLDYVYDDGSVVTQLYQDVLNGTYYTMGLSADDGTLQMAKEDGTFDKYAYVDEGIGANYLMLLNLNRGTYVLENGGASSVAKNGDEAKQIDYQLAITNKNFRKALMTAFDKMAFVSVAMGEDLAAINIKNIYTPYELCRLSKDVTDENGNNFTEGTPYGDIVQFYADELGLDIDLQDETNGWFNPEVAKEALEAAKEELGDAVTWPIHIDCISMLGYAPYIASTTAYKELIEGVLGSENVVVDVIDTDNWDDFLAAAWLFTDGESCGTDIFWDIAWGPEYANPWNDLNAFDPYGSGYMPKFFGLF